MEDARTAQQALVRSPAAVKGQREVVCNCTAPVAVPAVIARPRQPPASGIL